MRRHRPVLQLRGQLLLPRHLRGAGGARPGGVRWRSRWRRRAARRRPGCRGRPRRDLRAGSRRSRPGRPGSGSRAADCPAAPAAPRPPSRPPARPRRGPDRSCGRRARTCPPPSSPSRRRWEAALGHAGDTFAATGEGAGDVPCAATAVVEACATVAERPTGTQSEPKPASRGGSRVLAERRPALAHPASFGTLVPYRREQSLDLGGTNVSHPVRVRRRLRRRGRRARRRHPGRQPRRARGVRGRHHGSARATSKYPGTGPFRPYVQEIMIGGVVPLKDEALLNRTKQGYIYRAGQQNSDITITQVDGRRHLRRQGHPVVEVDGAGMHRIDVPRVCGASCVVAPKFTEAAPMLVEVWPRLGDDTSTPPRCRHSSTSRSSATAVTTPSGSARQRLRQRRPGRRPRLRRRGRRVGSARARRTTSPTGRAATTTWSPSSATTPCTAARATTACTAATATTRSSPAKVSTGPTAEVAPTRPPSRPRTGHRLRAHQPLLSAGPYAPTLDPSTRHLRTIDPPAPRPRPILRAGIGVRSCRWRGPTHTRSSRSRLPGAQPAVLHRPRRAAVGLVLAGVIVAGVTVVAEAPGAPRRSRPSRGGSPRSRNRSGLRAPPAPPATRDGAGRVGPHGPTSSSSPPTTWRRPTCAGCPGRGGLLEPGSASRTS